MDSIVQGRRRLTFRRDGNAYFVSLGGLLRAGWAWSRSGITASPGLGHACRGTAASHFHRQPRTSVDRDRE